MKKKKNKVEPYSEEHIVNSIEREDNPISWLCHVWCWHTQPFRSNVCWVSSCNKKIEKTHPPCYEFTQNIVNENTMVIWNIKSTGFDQCKTFDLLNETCQERRIIGDEGFNLYRQWQQHTYRMLYAIELLVCSNRSIPMDIGL